MNGPSCLILLLPDQKIAKAPLLHANLRQRLRNTIPFSAVMPPYYTNLAPGIFCSHEILRHAPKIRFNKGGTCFKRLLSKRRVL